MYKEDLALAYNGWYPIKPIQTKPNPIYLIYMYKEDLACDVTPSAPRRVIFFEPFLFTAGDQLVVPIGVTHISLPLHKIQSREREERE